MNEVLKLFGLFTGGYSCENNLPLNQSINLIFEQ